MNLNIQKTNYEKVIRSRKCLVEKVVKLKIIRGSESQKESAFLICRAAGVNFENFKVKFDFFDFYFMKHTYVIQFL